MKEFEMHFGRGTGSIHLDSDIFEDFVQTFNLPVFVNINKSLNKNKKLLEFAKKETLKLRFTIFQGRKIYCSMFR